MFAQHPFGIGVFCFPLLYPSYRSPLEQDTAGLFVHNDYVQFLVEGGVPLPGTAVACSSERYWVAPGCCFDRTRATPRLQISVSRSRCCAVCAHALVNFMFYSLPLSILVGLLGARLFSRAVAAARTEHADSEYRARRRRWHRDGLRDVAVPGAGRGNGRESFRSQRAWGLSHRFVATNTGCSNMRASRNASTAIEAFRCSVKRYCCIERRGRSRTRDYLPRAGVSDVPSGAGCRSVEHAELSALRAISRRVPAGGRTRLRVSRRRNCCYSQLGWTRSSFQESIGCCSTTAATSQESKGYGLLRNVVYPWMERLRRGRSECERPLL